ncbi:hypothetical protein H0H93_004117, partial [Arthromyces matolae]
PIVLLLDNEHCLEIVPDGMPFNRDPYFVSFLNLNLGLRVERFMGARDTLGVLLRRLRVVGIDGKPPLILQLWEGAGTHLEMELFKVIVQALLFAEKNKVAPNLYHVNQILVDLGIGRGDNPEWVHVHQFKQGMIGTASPGSLQEHDPASITLARINTYEYFVSFNSLGLGASVDNFMMQTIPMGVLLRPMDLVPSSDGKPPIVKWLPGSANKQLPEDLFRTILAALLLQEEAHQSARLKQDA